MRSKRARTTGKRGYEMPVYENLGTNGQRIGPRPARPLNLIELSREFICFDGRCLCGGLLLVFRKKTLYWDLVSEEEREQARKRLEKGASLESVKQDCWVGVDEMIVGECERCGRHYFWDPEIHAWEESE